MTGAMLKKCKKYFKIIILDESKAEFEQQNKLK